METPVLHFSFRALWQTVTRHHRAELGIIVLVTLVLLVFTFTRTRNTTNTRSRIITVERLVERGTMAHVAPGDTTPFQLSIDAAMVNGKIYSSKPPNYPYVMAAEAWVMRQLTGMAFYPHRKDYIRMLTIVNQVIPYTLMLLLLLLFARFYTADRFTLLFLLLMASVGSLVFGYSVTINNHTPAAIGFFIAFFLAWLILQQGRTARWYYGLFGLVASYSATIDLPGVAIAGVLWFLLLRHSWKGALIAGLVALIPIASTLGTYYSLTGSIQPFYMQFELYQYAGSYWNEPEALDARQVPKGQYAFHNLFGHNGLFSLTPVLLIGLWGYFWAIPKRKWEVSRLLLWVAPALVLILLFVIFRTGNYGGFCVGSRWLIITMPFLWLAAIPVLEKMGTSLRGRLAAAALLLLSTPVVGYTLYWEAFVRSFLEKWWLGQF